MRCALAQLISSVQCSRQVDLPGLRLVVAAYPIRAIVQLRTDSKLWMPVSEYVAGGGIITHLAAIGTKGSGSFQGLELGRL